MINQDMLYKEINKAISDCDVRAKHGYEFAIEAVALLKQVVISATDKLDEEIKKINSININNQGTINNLKNQLSVIRNNFGIIPEKLNEDIDAISKTTFSITLFGRTMSGKSTLMEILTHGNGKSIGHGAQRTTRDVRTYTYQGLQITDVPGIAAFDGQEDGDIAFDAAKKCDLILFLITDDAPQAREAECLCKIRELGKPVICLINVKTDIKSPNDIKMFKRDIQKKFDVSRLDLVKKQFIEFGNKYGQDWHTIRFAYVHLKSAFLSQQIEYKDISNDLYYLSQFNYVENVILNEVIKNGGFYKIKAYTDIVVVPIVDAFETLFSQSVQNSEQGSILVRKKRKLKKWTDDFEISSKRSIDYFLSTISSELKQEIAIFAENNYDNKEAGKDWNNIVLTKNIDKRASELLKQLGKDCEVELSEICREIHSEINYSHVIFSDNSINMDACIDGKRRWKWATTFAGAALTIFEMIVSGPAGWVGLGMSIISWFGSLFFDDHEKKILDARKKLEHKLIDNIDKMIIRIRKEMLDVLYENLLKGQIYPMENTIYEVINSLFTLSMTQQDFANALNKKMKEINMMLIKEALAYLGYNNLEKYISCVVRIPGNALTIVLKTYEHFPQEVYLKLFYLLKESIYFIYDTDNMKMMLMKAVGKGCAKDNINIQNINNVKRIAHIPSLDKVDATTKTRIRMAQQLSELLIMK